MTVLDLCAPWLLPAALRPGADCDPCSAVTDADTPSDAVLTAAILDASRFLWATSGYRYGGICETTITPCVGDCACSATPILLPGEGYPVHCGCPDTCCGPAGIMLGVHPVTEVTEVRLSGDVVDDSAYELVGDVLVRTDGQRWPTCQTLADPSFEVDVEWGVAPPSLGVRAARDLACVLIRADCGDDTCTEPANVVRKTGGGMTVEISSPVAEVARMLPMSVRLFLESEGVDFRSPVKMRRMAGRHRRTILDDYLAG